MFILTLFIFTTLAMWGSAMNYYFENYVDASALYAFLDKIGLVATEAGDGIGYSILNAFGLIVSSPDKAYEVGFGVFNMLGALVQFFGVILLSSFLANRYGKHRVFSICLLFPQRNRCRDYVCTELPQEPCICSDSTSALGYDC